MFKKKQPHQSLVPQTEHSFHSFEDAIEDLFKKPIEELPVYKDLFRLSPRLVVKRGEEGLVLPSPRKGEEGLWDCFIKESLVFADKYRASSWGELWREGVLKLEQQLGDVMVNVTAHHAVKDEEITLMTTNAKHVHPCEDSSRYFVLSPLETITKPENAAICSNCEKPDVVADYACKDCNENFCSECNDVLHRKKKLRAHVRKQISCVGVAFHSRIAANAFRECLASPEKINKFRSSVVIDSEKLTKSDTNLKEGSDSAQVAFVEKMMSLIAMLENEDMTAKAKKFFKDHLLQSNATVCPEMELVVRELVEDVLGKSSVTAGVLRLIHQRIVLATAFHLKSTVLKDIFTSDVRSAEGWRLVVEVYQDTIQVTHIRKEQSMAQNPEEEFFTFEYQISMILDRKAEHMINAVLRITSLEFGEKTSEPFKINMNRRLANGNLMIK